MRYRLKSPRIFCRKNPERRQVDMRSSNNDKFLITISIIFYIFFNAKRAWDRAPHSWYNGQVNLFSFGCHVIDRAYLRKGGVEETIKREGGVSQACLGKSTSCILDIHNMVN